MIKQVKAGHFAAQRDDDDSTKSRRTANKKNIKKRATFAAVEDKSKSKDDKEESMLPTYQQYLCLNGVIQLNVGADKTWDGDSVSEFGFGCLHVGRARASPEPNGVVFAGASDEPTRSPSE